MAQGATPLGKTGKCRYPLRMRIALLPLFLPTMLILAACATPVERCVNQASAAYRATFDELREAEATLARGYALRRVQVSVPFYTTCRGPKKRRYPCFRERYQTVTRRENVDLTEVRSRTQDLRAQLPALQRSADTGATQCRAIYAEAEAAG